MAAFALRISVQYIMAKRSGRRFDAFDRPVPSAPSLYTGAAVDGEGVADVEGEEDREAVLHVHPQKGKFF